jgi:hypothetical protein
MVNSAQIFERRGIKRVVALKVPQKIHESALYEVEGEI